MEYSFHVPVVLLPAVMYLAPSALIYIVVDKVCNTICTLLTHFLFHIGGRRCRPFKLENSLHIRGIVFSVV
jgi:hypothetical protein